jgi:hypothetical protein
VSQYTDSEKRRLDRMLMGYNMEVDCLKYLRRTGNTAPKKPALCSRQMQVRTPITSSLTLCPASRSLHLVTKFSSDISSNNVPNDR